MSSKTDNLQAPSLDLAKQLQADEQATSSSGTGRDSTSTSGKGLAGYASIKTVPALPCPADMEPTTPVGDTVVHVLPKQSTPETAGSVKAKHKRLFKSKALRDPQFSAFLKKADSVHKYDLKLAHKVDAMRMAFGDRSLEDPSWKDVRNTAEKVVTRAVGCNGIARQIRRHFQYATYRKFAKSIIAEAEDTEKHTFKNVMKAVNATGKPIGCPATSVSRESMKKVLLSMSQIAWTTSEYSVLNAEIARIIIQHWERERTKTPA